MQLVNKQTAGKAARYQTVAVRLANAGYRNGTEPTTTAKTKTFFHELELNSGMNLQKKNEWFTIQVDQLLGNFSRSLHYLHLWLNHATSFANARACCHF